MKQKPIVDIDKLLSSKMLEDWIVHKVLLVHLEKLFAKTMFVKESVVLHQKSRVCKQINLNFLKQECVAKHSQLYVLEENAQWPSILVQKYQVVQLKWSCVKMVHVQQIWVYAQTINVKMGNWNVGMENV